MNGRNVLKFTQVINTVLQSDMNIGQAMQMVQKMNGLPKKVAAAAAEVNASLEQGRLFSNALADCSAIDFGADYVAFVAAAERGGSLKSTFAFLLKRTQEKEKRRSALVSAGAYPLVVIVAAFAGGLFLAFNSKSIVPDVSGTFNFESYTGQVVRGCIKANAFLLASALFLFAAFRRLSKNGMLVDVVSIMTFLIQGHAGLDGALRISVLAAEKNVGLKRKIVQGRDLLQLGRPVSAVMECIDRDCALYARFAEIDGNMENAFVQMTEFLEDRKARREKLCMEMVEPVTMCIVAAYIIILLKSVVMPVIFYYGG